jgi:ornithine cyclodeaminase/alanine dehydrogenase-like protein (mu-crystallin family)
MTLFIREKEVDELITMDEAIKIIEEATRYQGQGLAKIIPRNRIYSQNFVFNVMSASIEPWNVVGLKTYLSTKKVTSFVIIIFDTNFTEPIAIIEADRLGQIRTGAASGLATKYLAKKNARIISVIGAGRQARTQVIGIAEALKAEKILVYSRTYSKAVIMAEELKKYNYDVEVVENYMKACDADVISTATNSKEPFLRPEWIKTGTHINLIGSNVISKAEAFPETIGMASLVVTDLKEQAMIESGDLIRAVEKGFLKWDSVRELWEVVLGNAKRVNDDEITIFKSHGIALWDVAIAKKVYEKAIKRNIGFEIELKGQWNIG